ncbi:hypothetical protein M7I_6464 [Glarea lozoyensis 74030]|uniref:Uncharacterized protein n=1 Tax=Glarea lozoyensis (strain ATCC 74030 / MF5533) TaxID=1104152 RepID=H0EUM7_GLAL7|nr:hypothetical protein M7I_6464 [Glarea lozoyensis 74030]
MSTSLLPTTTTSIPTSSKAPSLPAELLYIQYSHAHEKQYLPSIRALISRDLSEPLRGVGEMGGEEEE